MAQGFTTKALATIDTAMALDYGSVSAEERQEGLGSEASTTRPLDRVLLPMHASLQI